MKIDLNKIEGLKTPFYYYDRDLLARTLKEIKSCVADKPIKVHYALKANGNATILRMIASEGFGADCVSGNEVRAALASGFPAEKIFYAGVGKSDEEIVLGIEAGIGCFNIESVEEIDILDNLAKKCGKIANIALRVNPNIDAHTHHYITTGLKENKFGIDLNLVDKALKSVSSSGNLRLIGLHFHIGSQITTMEPFKILCERINVLKRNLKEKGVDIKILNVGGGLGIDYDNPDENPIPEFRDYFNTLTDNIELDPDQEIHCELGRSVVGQCGSLISRVVLVKHGLEKKYVIVDAGMSDLIRPALYGAHHNIENLTSAGDSSEKIIYDVVGPICESSDVFAENEKLSVTKRGDLIAIRSAGAYGETMASRYNMRDLPGSVVV